MQEEQQITTISGCLLRLLWIMLGPAFLFICAVVIGVQKASFPGAFDIIYGILVILISLARVIEDAKASSTPAEPSVTPVPSGNKLSPALKYLAVFIPIAIGLWLLAHLI
jgi:hypothetical protein